MNTCPLRQEDIKRVLFYIAGRFSPIGGYSKEQYNLWEIATPNMTR